MSDIKQFNWQSDRLSKQSDFYQFHDLLLRHLGLKGITFCLNTDDTNFYRPVPPPANATAAERAKLLQGYQESLRKFYGNFDTALGILRSSFVYNTYAYSLIEKALNKPQDVAEQDWTPDKRFKAAYDKLVATFAPQDSTDVNQLRRQIQEITDVNLGGFDEYVSEFNRLHLALIKAQATPTDTEAREWVMKGLENMTVKSFIVTNILLPNPQATFTQIFETTRRYLKYMGDNDAYKTIVAQPSGKPIVSALAVNVGPDRCTRCWRPNHKWMQCTAKFCSICNQAFNGGKYCLNYLNHREPATRWAPPHLVKEATRLPAGIAPSTTIDGTIAPIPNPVTPDSNYKQAKRALAAAFKDLREAREAKRARNKKP